MDHFFGEDRMLWIWIMLIFLWSVPALQRRILSDLGIGWTMVFMVKHGEPWWNMVFMVNHGFHGETWWNMVRHGETWWNLAAHIEHRTDEKNNFKTDTRLCTSHGSAVNRGFVWGWFLKQWFVDKCRGIPIFVCMEMVQDASQYFMFGEGCVETRNFGRQSSFFGSGNYKNTRFY